MKIKIKAASAKVYQNSRSLRVYAGDVVECDDEWARVLIDSGAAEGSGESPARNRDPETVENRDPAPAKKRGRPPKSQSD